MATHRLYSNHFSIQNDDNLTFYWNTNRNRFLV